MNKKIIHKPHPQSILLNIPRESNSSKGERGIALLMTLIMGALLIAGANALIIRQLTARKLGASESYQQMAETAAVSGFNRILSQLNNPKRSAYKGYLYNLDNNPSDGWNWEKVNDSSSPPLEEACLPTTNNYSLPKHPVQSTSLNWPRDTVPLLSTPKTPALNTLRSDGKQDLRSYYRLRSFESDIASNKGIGIFTVEGLVKRAGTAESDVMSRTLLTRSLDIKTVVVSPHDWAMIASAQYSKIDNITIDGKGLIFWNVNDGWSRECDQKKLKSLIGSSFISGGNETKSIPGTNGSEKLPLIWPVINRGIPGASIFNHRGVADKNVAGIRVWSFDDSDSNSRGINCSQVACTRNEMDKSLNDITNAPITASGDTITIKENEICTTEPNPIACHMYVEHINLRKTTIHIENSTRPVVLHLLSPNTDREDIPSPIKISTGSIILRENAKVCGVDRGNSLCNAKPQQLIITNNESDGDFTNICSSKYGLLEFGGNRLPAAWIALQSGTVRLNTDTTIRGVIWSQNLCAENFNLTLKTNNKVDPTISIVEDAETSWEWRKQNLWGGHGRQTIRGIRGSGMDLFEKF